MAINSNFVKNYQTAEYGKFVEIINSSAFPPISVTRWSYPDTTTAFPGNSSARPLSSVDIYPKYAVLTHISNPEDISVSLSAGSINVNVADVEDLVRRTNTLIEILTSTSNRINGFVIPNYNRIANTYYGTSNNLSKVDYKQNNTIVASLSFTYLTPTSADGALLGEVIKIL